MYLIAIVIVWIQYYVCQYNLSETTMYGRWIEKNNLGFLVSIFFHKIEEYYWIKICENEITKSCKQSLSWTLPFSVTSEKTKLVYLWTTDTNFLSDATKI